MAITSDLYSEDKCSIHLKGSIRNNVPQKVFVLKITSRRGIQCKISPMRIVCLTLAVGGGQWQHFMRS